MQIQKEKYTTIDVAGAARRGRPGPTEATLTVTIPSRSAFSV